MNKEKAAAIASLENILPLNDWRGRIISLEGICRTSLTKEIEEAKQSPLKSNIPPTSFRGNGLLPTP